MSIWNILNRLSKKIRRADNQQVEVVNDAENESISNEAEPEQNPDPSDENKGDTLEESLQVSIRSLTSARARRFKETFNGLIQEIWTKYGKMTSEITQNRNQCLVNCIETI